MESIHQVKQELVARSETTSLDELQSRGKKHVKVIKAAHIAGMIREAVERTIQNSSLISKEEADRLIEESHAEFESVVADRKREAQVASEREEELARLRTRAAELERDLAVAQAAAAGAAGAPRAGDPSSEMMMRLMTEVAQLKAGGAPAAAGATGDGAVDADTGDSLTKALDNISSSMNARLDQMGKKLGISSAVAADDVKFDALFNNMDDADMESNIENMEVKKKTGAGIAGNLAKLKKLKGGGD